MSLTNEDIQAKRAEIANLKSEINAESTRRAEILAAKERDVEGARLDAEIARLKATLSSEQATTATLAPTTPVEVAVTTPPVPGEAPAPVEDPKTEGGATEVPTENTPTPAVVTPQPFAGRK